jgi:sortase A
MSAVLAKEAPETVLRSVPVDASPPPGGVDQDRLRLGVSQVLLGTSFILVWALLYMFVLSGFEQSHAQSRLYKELRSQLAEGTAPVGAPIAPGSPVALLSIPNVGVEDLVVVEGSRPAQLQDGPGHRLGSVLPGQQGTSVIEGRSLSFGGPFKDIARLQVGESILVTTAQGEFAYTVIGLRKDGDPSPAPVAAGKGRLTLRTALRESGLGGIQASELLFVDADLDKAVVGGPKSTMDVQAPEPMRATLDATTLALLALSLQLLVAALVGFTWAWARWSRPAAWIAGAPVVLATLWLASSIGSRLLPGLV